MRGKNKIIAMLVLLAQLMSGICQAQAVPERDCLAPSLNIAHLAQAEMFFGKFLLQANIPYLNPEDVGDMRWIEFGQVEDITPDIVQFRDFNGRQQTQINGLEKNVEMGLPGGRRLFITDDEQQVLPFWWKMRKQGLIGDNASFLHVDAHLDTLIVKKVNLQIPEKASVRDVYDLSFVAQESGFLVPAFASGVLNKNSAYLMDPRLSLLASRLEVVESNGQIQHARVSPEKVPPIRVKPSLVSVDLDALAGLSKEEAYKTLDYLAKLCQGARAVTICTSPVYMTDQKAAIDYAKYLARLLREQGSGDYALLPKNARPTTWEKLFNFVQKHQYFADAYYHADNPSCPTGCASFSCLVAKKMEEESFDVFVLWSSRQDHFYLSVAVETNPGFFEEVIIDYTADQTKAVNNSPLIETRTRLKEKLPATYDLFWTDKSQVMRQKDVLMDNFYLEYIQIWEIVENLKQEDDSNNSKRNEQFSRNELQPQQSKADYAHIIDVSENSQTQTRERLLNAIYLQETAAIKARPKISPQEELILQAI